MDQEPEKHHPFQTKRQNILTKSKDVKIYELLNRGNYCPKKAQHQQTTNKHNKQQQTPLTILKCQENSA